MAFQTGHVPGLDTPNPELQHSELLYSGARGVAVRILSRAESSDFKLEKLIDQEIRLSEWTPYDRALLIELVYGTLRWQARLDWVLTGFYHGEFTKCIVPVKNAMRIALYQILMLSKIPPSVAITECANTIRRIKDDKSANIISGVLKNILRNVEGIRYPSKDDNRQLFLSVTLSHPLWIVKRWCERFGEETAEKVLSANNERPSIFLSANTSRMSRDEMTQWLKEHECTFELVHHSDDMVRINGLQNVGVMDIYTEGKSFMAHASDIELVALTNVQPGQRVLCLGAAQSVLVLALAQKLKGNATFIAVSNFESMIPVMESRIKLLGFNSISVIHQDALEKDQVQCDVVVVEATSSGLGILNIRPELRWKLELDAVRKSSQSQRRSLEAAVAHVAPKGSLLYCCPSLETEETTDIVTWFLEQHPEFVREDAAEFCQSEHVHEGNLHTRLYEHKIDTLFAARFRRRD